MRRHDIGERRPRRRCCGSSAARGARAHDGASRTERLLDFVRPQLQAADEKDAADGDRIDGRLADDHARPRRQEADEHRDDEPERQVVLDQEGL